MDEWMDEWMNNWFNEWRNVIKNDYFQMYVIELNNKDEYNDSWAGAVMQKQEPTDRATGEADKQTDWLFKRFEDAPKKHSRNNNS